MVKGAIKEGSKKGGRGGVRSSHLKTQLKTQDEDKRRQLESSLCYTRYPGMAGQAGASCIPCAWKAKN